MKNPYETLSVEKSASDDEIKKAYRKLALRYHPDKTDKKEDEALFKEINEAYAILSDSKKRANFDATGDVNMADMPDMSDIFSSMFGSDSGFQNMGGFHNMGGFPGGFASFFQDFNQKRRKKDVLNIEISLEEVYNGNDKEISYETLEICKKCDGKGTPDLKDIITCIKCKGKGSISIQINPIMIGSTMCNSCNGNGNMIRPNKECTNCKGDKTQYVRKQLLLKIPKGIPQSFMHELKGKGGYSVDNKEYNDLTIVFNYVVPQNVHVDSENNVTCHVNITLLELLCGFKKTIKPYGRDITIVSNKTFNPHKQYEFNQFGLPKFKSNIKGNFYIKFDISYTSKCIDTVNNKNEEIIKMFEVTKDEETLHNKKDIIIIS